MQLLLAGFIAWFVAQLVKFSLRALHGTPDFKLFYQSGGMPSAHSATVIAVAVAALIVEGLQSPIFGIATILAAIVIYDSLGIRRSSGEQSVMMNVLLKTAGNTKFVKEVMGHTPKEVAVGASLGTIVALFFTFNAWSDQVSWLVSSPFPLERSAYLAIFLILLVVAVIGLIQLRRLRSTQIISTLKMALWWGMVTPGFVGLFVSLLQYQTRGPGAWRIWALLLILSVSVVHIILFGRLYRFAKSRYEQESAILIARRKQQRVRAKQTKKTKRRR